MIGKTISHYKILEKLGEGGMGVVYKAQDTKLKRMVALKFLPQELLCGSESKSRFIHEAQAASALNHPNITTIYEIDEVNQECFISMEYIEGKSIKELTKEKKLSIKEILEIAIQVSEGLTAAHEKGIVHRDIKSDNIMFTPRGQVKIMDFGLAKLKGVTKLTKTGSTLGTLQYMSPEQAQGIEVDQRSDIFSFGVVLYEMITRQLPFSGEHEAAIIYSIVNETPEPLTRYKANVPEELQRIVDKALKKDRNIRYQSAAQIIADLKGLQKETVAGVVAKPKRKLLPVIVSASVVFILVLLFLIFKPFKFEIAPEKGAIAKENSLAIMYFENLKDPQDKDKIAQMITALLITGLSESPEYMQVVSSQRLYDILKLLGKEDLKVIDKTVASEVAKKAGVRWILTGKVLQTKPNIVLISEISEATTGKIKATQRVSGATGEDVFAVVDKLSPQMATALSLPEQAKKELEKSVADVTTHSPEAYRYYLEGIDYRNKFSSKEAKESFKKALEYDTTFAMAYYRLAQYDWNKEFIAKAIKYSKNASQKEKQYIKAEDAYQSGRSSAHIKELQKIVECYPEEKEAFLYLGDFYSDERQFEQAIHYLNKAIEIDPLYKRAYNSLAYTYKAMDNFEESIWAIDKYISLAPDEANPYDSRGDIYAYFGKIDQALESYKKANQIYFCYSCEKLGNMYLFKNEYAMAESCYKELASNSEKNRRTEGRTHLALIPLRQGKFEEALAVLDNGIAADKMEQVDLVTIMDKNQLKMDIYKQKKEWSKALKEAELYMAVYRKDNPDFIGEELAPYIMLLAESNNLKKAKELVEALKKDIEKKDPGSMSLYWALAGYIELAKGNFKASITNFEQLDVALIRNFAMRYWLARAYLEANRLSETIAEFEKALSTYDLSMAWNPIWAVKAHYFLGLAYEKSSWNDKAIQQYKEFLDIWKNADPGIPEVEDAKARLKKLKAES
jgi:tetratricopeptide (TPR) repeat protein/TolB-like protein/predicted Ser/Thr protein kinase